MNRQEEEVDDLLDESQLIHEAVAIHDMINHCQLLTIPIPTSTSYQLSFKRSGDFSKLEQKGILDILIQNMETLYQQANWGWDINQQQKELFHITSRFLYLIDNCFNPVITAPNAPLPPPTSPIPRIAGYVMFRFEWDDEDEPEHPVLFVYELQVSAEYQHRGIGSYLMKCVNQIAKQCKMWKIMLTCFKENKQALNFYLGHLGYGVDINSPSRCGYEEETYEIISNQPNLR